MTSVAGGSYKEIFDLLESKHTHLIMMCEQAGVNPIHQLSHINAPGADLRESDLSGFDLSFAQLSGADLSGSDVFLTDFSYADIQEKSFSITRNSDCALLPISMRKRGSMFDNSTDVALETARGLRKRAFWPVTLYDQRLETDAFFIDDPTEFISSFSDRNEPQVSPALGLFLQYASSHPLDYQVDIFGHEAPPNEDGGILTSLLEIEREGRNINTLFGLQEDRTNLSCLSSVFWPEAVFSLLHLANHSIARSQFKHALNYLSDVSRFSATFQDRWLKIRVQAALESIRVLNDGSASSANEYILFVNNVFQPEERAEAIHIFCWPIYLNSVVSGNSAAKDITQRLWQGFGTYPYIPYGFEWNEVEVLRSMVDDFWVPEEL